MKRLFFAVLMASLLFAILNFVYCNVDQETFGYDVVFKFSIPHLFSLQSSPISLGFVILIAFFAGMIALPLFEALPSFSKTLELRSRNKRIKQLERELKVIKEMQKEGSCAENSPPL